MSFDVTRRQLLATGAAVAALPLVGDRASAQGAWPNKPIRVVVGYPAGGQTDMIARSYSDFLTRQLGQPVIVENKAGAGGTVGAVEVKRAAPDGYTLMCTISTTLVLNRGTMKSLPYDTEKDFVLFSAITGAGLQLVASEKCGAKTLKELIEYAKKNGKASIGSYAAGSAAHMMILELNKQYGVNIEAVNYRGEAPMWGDLASQSIDAAIGSYNAGLGVLQTNRGRAIAVTGTRRLKILPDVPTMLEQGVTSKLYSLRGFTGWGAPTGTPPEIVKKLADLMVAGGKDAKVQEVLATFDLDPPMSFDETQKLLSEETPLWLKFMADLGIQPE
jgi:tripartite-type tricarboxylate transporter receptor subunit TctC